LAQRINRLAYKLEPGTTLATHLDFRGWTDVQFPTLRTDRILAAVKEE